MAITKILPRNTGLSQAIQYALNGDTPKSLKPTANVCNVLTGLR